MLTLMKISDPAIRRIYMYANNDYLNNTTMDIKDKSKPLIVTSCGTYHLYTRPKLPTWRPRGHLDFQLLYIASGKAHFHFDGKEEIVTAGHMVLYRPRKIRPKCFGFTLQEMTSPIFFDIMVFPKRNTSTIVGKD